MTKKSMLMFIVFAVFGVTIFCMNEKEQHKVIDPNTEIQLRGHEENDPVHKVIYKDVQHSQTIQHLIEDVGTEQVIPLPNVSDTVLKDYIIPALQEIQKNKEASKNQESDENESDDESKPFDELIQKLHKVEIKVNIDVMNAANYLDIKDFLNALIDSFYEKFIKSGSGIIRDDINTLSMPLQKIMAKKILGEYVLCATIPRSGAICLSLDWSILAVQHKNTISVFDTVTMQLRQRFEAVGDIVSMHVSKDNKTLIIVKKNSLEVKSIESGQSIDAPIFSGDKIIFQVSIAGNICTSKIPQSEQFTIVDMKSKAQIAELSGTNHYLSPDGTLCVYRSGKQIKQYDIQAKTESVLIDTIDEKKLTAAMCISPDNKYCVVLFDDKKFSVLNVDSKASILEGDCYALFNPNIVFSNTGNKVAFLKSTDSLYECNLGTNPQCIEMKFGNAYSFASSCLSYSKKGSTLLVAKMNSKDTNVMFYQRGTQKLKFTINKRYSDIQYGANDKMLIARNQNEVDVYVAYDALLNKNYIQQAQLIKAIFKNSQSNKYSIKLDSIEAQIFKTLQSNAKKILLQRCSFDLKKTPIKLQGKGTNTQNFEIPASYAQHSQKLKQELQCKLSNTLMGEGDGIDKPITIKNVSHDVLQKYIAPALEAIGNTSLPSFVSKVLSHLEVASYVNILNVADSLQISQLSEEGAKGFYKKFLAGKDIEHNVFEAMKLLNAPIQKTLTSMLSCIRTIDNKSEVKCVRFSPDGKTIAYGSTDKTIKIVGVASGKELKKMSGHMTEVHAVCFSPDGKTLASASNEGKVLFWDLESKKNNSTSYHTHDKAVYAVDFNARGTRLISCSADKTVRQCDLIKEVEIEDVKEEWNRSDLYAVQFGCDGESYFLAVHKDVVYIKNKNIEKTYAGHTGIVRSIALSPGDKWLASGSFDTIIKLWNVENGLCARTLVGHTKAVRSVSFSPDGTLLASGSDDGSIKVWDVATGELCETLLGHTSSVNSVCWNPDGTMLASGGEDGMKLWFVSSVCTQQSETVSVLDQVAWIKNILQNKLDEDVVVKVNDENDANWKIFKAISSKGRQLVTDRCSFVDSTSKEITGDHASKPISRYEQIDVVMRVLNGPQSAQDSHFDSDQKYKLDFATQSGDVFNALSEAGRDMIRDKCSFYNIHYEEDEDAWEYDYGTWHGYLSAIKEKVLRFLRLRNQRAGAQN